MPRLFILLLCLSLSLPTFADTRCALVIGNGAYPAKKTGKNDLSPLANPANDAKDMAKLLQDSGIVLVDHEGENRPLINASKEQMDTAVDNFIAQLPGCSAALFYFSGHGVYLRDITRPHESANYLLPVGQNFRAADPGKIKHNAVNAHAIKDRIQNSGVKAKLMILDACRERLVLEESKGFGGGEEFLPMNAVNGMMVVYATLHSYVSYGDKSRRNSVFTEHLLAALQQGGEITRAIGKAIEGVEQANLSLPEEHRQHPWPEGLLTSEFCLQDCDKPDDGQVESLQAQLAALQADIARLQESEQLALRLGGQGTQSSTASPQRTASAAGKKITVSGKTYLAYDNGTALDTQTGLMWMRCFVGQTWNGNTCTGEAKEFDWKAARKLTDNFAGYSDWHIPTIEQLRTLVYCSNGKPAYFNNGKPGGEEYVAQNYPNHFDWGCEGEKGQDHETPTLVQSVFPNMPAWAVWSGSPVSGNSDNAWVVNFYYGHDHYGYYRDDHYLVRLVRERQ